MKLFFSWQSDIKYNKAFLNKCLKEVQKLLPELEVDSAERNPEGADDIANTIFNKIDNSNLFLADISIINANADKEFRKTPNPNVLYELGYAMKTHGKSGVILVANKDYGENSNEYPFDLRNRRILIREFSDNSITALAKEIAVIIQNKNVNKTIEKPIQGPYIFAEVDQSSTNNIDLIVINDEDNAFFLESLEIGNTSYQILQNLKGKGSTKVTINNAKYPFKKRHSTIKIKVNRNNKEYIIFQRIYLQKRADKDYNLVGIEKRPYKIIDSSNLNSNKSFDPYEVKKEWLNNLLDFLKNKEASVANIKIHYEDLGEKISIRILFKHTTVYSLDIMKTSSFSSSVGISFYGVTGESSVSSGSSNAWGEFKWNESEQAVVLNLHDMSLFKSFSNEEQEYTFEEFAETLWDSVSEFTK